jgi:hypothetical protein
VSFYLAEGKYGTRVPRPVRKNDEGGGRKGDRDGAFSALPFSQAR